MSRRTHGLLRQATWSRTVVTVIIGLVAALGTVAGATGALAADRAPDLPPATRDALARLFDPQLEQLGLRTTRARLQNLRSYRTDANGRHLAIYVEPIESMTDAEYLENVTKVSRIFLPRVFKEWKDLQSFDICQEPVPGVDDREAPPPVTQLVVSRKGFRRVNWKAASLGDLLQAATIPPGAPPSSTRDFFLFVNSDLVALPAYQAARATVTTTPGATTPPAG